MSRSELLQKITRAQRDITVAESELNKALDVMQTAAGGEKVSISQVLEDAFTKLREAKGSLSKLEVMLLSET